MVEVMPPISDSLVSNPAKQLDASNLQHIIETVEIIKTGGIVAFPFNGIFGLFGDIDNIKAAEAIVEAKERPKDKKLIAVTSPETFDHHADLSRTNYPKASLISLFRSVHALGVILPASTRAPYHLINGEGMDRSILIIWTEFPPLRNLINMFDKQGGRGLVGTSANKASEPTHYDPNMLYDDFKYNVQAVVYDRFDHLPRIRRRSTSIIDLTGNSPRLHREGNVTEDEIRDALKEHGFPPLIVGRDIISVRGRD